MMENQDEIAFLPFHALNRYMRDDYRELVVRSVLTQQNDLPDKARGNVNRLTKEYVKVVGFRNPSAAPLMIRFRPTLSAFQKHPEFTAAVIAAWAELHAPLRTQMHDLLKARGWDILPADADRTQMPGFFTNWPKGEDFEVINTAFKEMYPEAEETTDDVSLMAVWMALRLPFFEETESETDSPQPTDHATSDPETSVPQTE